MTVRQKDQSVAQSSRQGSFSVEAFRALFNRSVIRKYLSAMDVEQVRIALEDKDMVVLQRLYEVLLQAEAKDEKIVREFVITKNKILDKFYVESMGIHHQIVVGSIQKRSAKAHMEDETAAEDILKHL